MADLVIRNGTVVDGTGAKPFVADIAITGGKISAVGPNLPAAKTEINAAGRLVTPGFVDIHTHFDGDDPKRLKNANAAVNLRDIPRRIQDNPCGTLAWLRRRCTASPLQFRGGFSAGRPWLGRDLTGACRARSNCGVGFAPVRPGTQAKLIELMEGIEDIPGPVLSEGLDFSWESFSQYLDKIASRPHDIDVCTLVPHAAVRVYVMGDRAVRLEAATPADIEAQRKIVADGVRAGAFGFSTSRTLNHRTLKGDPTPTLRAQEEELAGIAQGLKDAGAGLIQLNSDFVDPNKEFAMIRRLVEESGRPLTFLLAEAHNDPTQKWKHLLEMSDKAAAQGVNIRPVFPPRAIGVLLGLQGSQNPFAATATYRSIADLPLEQRVAAMRDPATKARILSEDRVRDATAPAVPRMPFERMFNLGNPPNYTPRREDSIAAMAQRQGRTAEEVAYDLLLVDEGKNFLYTPFANYENYSLAASEEMLRHPNALVGLSDGGAHVGMIMDGSFPTFLLSYWGKERGMPIEELVRRQTSDTARSIGLTDRGMLKVGMKADINVINWDELALEAPVIQYDLPAGGKRLMQRARGYEATIVSGVVTYRNGEPTGALPGKLVRSQGGLHGGGRRAAWQAGN